MSTRCRFRWPAATPLIMIALFLTACAGSPPETIVQTQVIKVRPPESLLADLPPPPLPAQLGTREDLDDVTLAGWAWGAELRARLSALRTWARQ